MNKFEPIHIIWHIGNVCNSNCNYCFTSSPQSTERITNSYWKIIVNRINKEKSIKRVSIIGGEPLLVNELSKIVKNLRKDILINIDSNLVNIKEKWDISFKRTYFCTTIDSIDENIHTKTRSHSVRETLDGIKFLLNNGVKVRVVIVVTKWNIDMLNKTARFLLGLGVDTIGISRVRMIGKAIKFGYSYFYDDIGKIKKKLSDIVKGLVKDYGKNRINVHNLWHDEIFFNLGYNYEPSCKCALFKAYIDWKGFLYPCELMPFYWNQFFNTYKIEKPDLKKESIFDAFSNSKLFKFFREKMLYYPVGCESCRYKKNCNHGCRFYSFLISGSLSSKDIICGADTIYDVIGYNYYSPLSEIGRNRLKGETGKFIKSLSKRLGEKIYDLGCGGGLWSFFLEDLGKKVVGVDNDRTMILIASEYKKLNNKKSKFIFSDVFEYSYTKFNSVIMLDNVISSFSKKKFISLLDILKDKIKFLLIEISKNELRNGTFNYKFNSFDIKEIVNKKTKEVYERKFFNKQTGATFKILSFFWNPTILKKILENYGKIKIEKETSKSYLYLVEFN